MTHLRLGSTAEIAEWQSFSVQGKSLLNFNIGYGLNLNPFRHD